MIEEGGEIDILIRKVRSTGEPLRTQGIYKEGFEKLLDCGLLPKKARRPKKKKEV